MTIIQLEGVSKIYQQPIKEKGLRGAVKHLFIPEYTYKNAVDNISISIDEGEAVAFLGSNGAGKSTTIKMMTGVLVPTNGNILINGFVPHNDRIRYTKSIGVVFGQRTQLWWDIPIIESFDMLKEIYEISESDYKSNMERTIELLGLSEFMHLSARRLSLGQRMRADLAAAFLHNPQIVFLDEPTIGLDIDVKQDIRRFIKQINEDKGTTVILTTHDLDDIDDICQRLIVIDKGRIIHDGNLRDAKDRFAKERIIHLKLSSEVQLESFAQDLQMSEILLTNTTELTVKFDRFTYTAGDIVAAVSRKTTVIDFLIEEPNISQVVRKINENSKGNQNGSF